MKIICLGYDCCMRTLLTKLKYKPSKKEGELSMPFDLTIHSYEAMCYYLEHDFSNYFENIVWQTHYCDIRKKDVKNMVNHKGVFFVHESHYQNTEDTPSFNSDTWTSGSSDVDFHENNMMMLKQRYFQRIANFYNVLSSKEEILFVLSTHIDIDVTILEKIIRDQYPELSFKIYCLRIYNTTESQEPFNKCIIDNMIINSCKLSGDGFWNTSDENRLIIEKVIHDDLQNVCV
jgi:hypothetical protein